MIIANKETVQIQSNPEEICTELTGIIDAVRKIMTKEYDEKIAERIINEAVKMSKMTDEEIDLASEMIEEGIKAQELLVKIQEMIKEGLGE